MSEWSLLAALVLLWVYLVWVRKGFLKKRMAAGHGTGLGANLAGYRSMITDSKRTALAGLVLGIACGFHMFVMKGYRDIPKLIATLQQKNLDRKEVAA